MQTCSTSGAMTVLRRNCLNMYFIVEQLDVSRSLLVYYLKSILNARYGLVVVDRIHRTSGIYNNHCVKIDTLAMYQRNLLDHFEDVAPPNDA